MLLFGYILIALLLISLVYMAYNQYKADQVTEGFYPRWGWGHGGRWGWRRPWLRGWGNWRPYGYYPAYSGYWKQCPTGVWCPQTMSCMNPTCQ